MCVRITLGSFGENKYYCADKVGRYRYLVFIDAVIYYL